MFRAKTQSPTARPEGRNQNEYRSTVNFRHDVFARRHRAEENHGSILEAASKPRRRYYSRFRPRLVCRYVAIDQLCRRVGDILDDPASTVQRLQAVRREALYITDRDRKSTRLNSSH